MSKRSNEDFHKIRKPSWYLLPLEWSVAWFQAGPLGTKTKFNKINCENIEAPYLIFSNHGSTIDFSNLSLVMKPNVCTWVASVEEFNGREWLMRHVGCVPKRKYTKDTVLIRNIVKTIQKDKLSCVIYPEARFSLCGINERTGEALGKFAKLCKAPVIVFNQRGNYLHSPQWQKKPVRKNPIEADFICVATKEEVATLSAEELQKRIEEAFVYDDYKWQYENKIEDKSKKRALNLHKILYKCPVCNKEFNMTSHGTTLECTACNSKWHMDEYSRLHLETEGKTWDESLAHIPAWYLWEKECVKKEILDGTYEFKDDVRVEYLVNSRVKFRPIGECEMIQNEEGIKISGTLYEGSNFEFFKPASSTSSVHIEYNYKGRGDALDIADLEDTYFIFPLHYDNVVTKIHFATELLYDKALGKLK